MTVPKENVKELLGKAKDGIVKAMDQNGDGTFDMKDVSVIAGSLGNAAKDTISSIKKKMPRKEAGPRNGKRSAPFLLMIWTAPILH